MPPITQDLSFGDDQLHRAAARVGQFVSARWHLDSLIGCGGMAAVYAATHRNGTRVAIKMLHPDLSIRVGVKERFIEEGYIANRVIQNGGDIHVRNLPGKACIFTIALPRKLVLAPRACGDPSSRRPSA